MMAHQREIRKCSDRIPSLYAYLKSSNFVRCHDKLYVINCLTAYSVVQSRSFFVLLHTDSAIVFTPANSDQTNDVGCIRHLRYLKANGPVRYL